jgi:hypothetical protein
MHLPECRVHGVCAFHAMLQQHTEEVHKAVCKALATLTASTADGGDMLCSDTLEDLAW